MSEAQPPALPDAPEPSSLAARMLNVIAAPGEVFDEIKVSKPSVSNWLVPLLLACIVMVSFTCIAFHQENVLRSLRQQQEEGIRKSLAKAGKSADADKVIEAMEKFMTPTLMSVFGSVGGVLAMAAMQFLGAFLLWLLARFALKAPVGFHKALEVLGLCSVISSLGLVAKTFVVVATGNMAMTLSPALLVKDFNPANAGHLALTIPDVTMLWSIGVVACGLARVTGVSWWRAAAWIVPIWLALAGGAIMMQALR